MSYSTSQTNNREKFDSCIPGFIGAGSVTIAVLLMVVTIQFFSETSYKSLKIVGLVLAGFEILAGLTLCIGAIYEREKPFKPWMIYNTLVLIALIGMLIYVSKVADGYKKNRESFKIILIVLTVLTILGIITVAWYHHKLKNILESNRQYRLAQSEMRIERENFNNTATGSTFTRQSPSAPSCSDTGIIITHLGPNDGHGIQSASSQLCNQDIPPNYDSVVDHSYNHPPQYPGTKSNNSKYDQSTSYGWNT